MLKSLEERGSDRHNTNNKISFSTFSIHPLLKKRKDWTGDKGQVRAGCFNLNLTAVQEVLFSPGKGKRRQSHKVLGHLYTSYSNFLLIHAIPIPMFQVKVIICGKHSVFAEDLLI